MFRFIFSQRRGEQAKQTLCRRFRKKMNGRDQSSDERGFPLTSNAFGPNCLPQ